MKPMRALLALSALLAAATSAAAPIREVRPLDTRTVGYLLGDRVPRAVTIRVDRDWHLQPTSLPAPGPQAYWLELRAVSVDERVDADARVYRITLDYQTFYAPIQALERTLPAFELGFARDGETAAARVPPFVFTMSPLREVKRVAGGEDGADIALRPDIVPGPRPLRPALVALLAGAGTAVALALLLARHYARWPFQARPARPFAQAARRLRRDRLGYRDALRVLHRAFDAAAGQRVLAEDAGLLIARRPQLAPLAPDIARFFAASRLAFYGAGEAEAGAVLPAAGIATLARRLAAAERRPA
ncbi:hypothetical protein [Dokdonella koreensis]|uniref:MxaA protein n=1 Tax=Dokdonella koreensis DS-123 TaxID=1300342 RepID=A0A160DT30_9GAMM|nr:hypothetical protein [Dokdonella koreensis]ANB17091.1 MxaA protein [Dokdonella koreensis DS-123]